MENNSAIITIMATIIMGSLCLTIAEKTKTPAILYYFITGLIFGKYAVGIINAESLGGGLSIIISLFVCIILFEGGLSLNVSQLRKINKSLLLQITLTLAIMFPAAYIGARYIMNFSQELSLTFASLTVVTGPTVIKPIIRHIPLRNRVKSFLNGEAVIIDALGAILAIVTLDYVLSTHLVQNTILRFLYTIGIGVLIGVITGFAAKFTVMHSSIIVDSVKSLFILGIVFLAYIIAETIAKESGLMSVTVTGIIMSTLDFNVKETLLSFKDKLTQMIIAILFIILSSHINILLISSIALMGIVTIVILIAVRFPIVYLSTLGGDFNASERLFMGWIGPRGIIAVSVASIAGIKLSEAGFEGTDAIVLLIFMLMAVTVMTQGFTAGLLARKMDITVQGDRNILLLGINDISLIIAKLWRSHGNDVIFIDSYVNNRPLAVNNGFACVIGNGLSSTSYSGIDMEHFNSAFAVTSNNEINVMFCRFIKETYGISKLYSVISSASSDELDEVIRFGDIRTINLSSVSDRKRTIVQSIFQFLKMRKIQQHSITIRENDDFDVDQYSRDIEGHPIAVVRNGDCHIYVPSMKLKQGDELFFISYGNIGKNKLY